MTKDELRKQMMVSMRIMDVFIANCCQNIKNDNIVSFSNGLFKFATEYWGGAISAGVRIYFTHAKYNSTYLSINSTQSLEELSESAMKEPFSESEKSYATSIAEKIINELNNFHSTGNCSYSLDSSFSKCMDAATAEYYRILSTMSSQITNSLLRENDYLQDTIDFIFKSIQCGILLCYITKLN